MMTMLNTVPKKKCCHKFRQLSDALVPNMTGMLSTQKHCTQHDPESGQIEIVGIAMLPAVTVVLFVENM
jgi:hypothetical protein